MMRIHKKAVWADKFATRSKRHKAQVVNVSLGMLRLWEKIRENGYITLANENIVVND